MSSRERTQPGAVGAEPSPGATLPWREGSSGFDALLSLWRSRRRLILSVAAVGTALAIVAGLQVQPRFTATAAVVIAPRQSNIHGRYSRLIATTRPEQPAPRVQQMAEKKRAAPKDAPRLRMVAAGQAGGHPPGGGFVLIRLHVLSLRPRSLRALRMLALLPLAFPNGT
jgi:hypothetical protein